MMMDTAVQQPTDANGQPIVTPAERQAVLQKLAARWSHSGLATKVEREAYDKSNGVKQTYMQNINKFYQHVQNQLINRTNQQQQQQQQMNANLAFSNAQPNINQPSTMPIVQQMNTMPRFPTNQTATRMINPSINNPNSMTRLPAMPNLSFGQTQSSTPPTATTTIDFSSSVQPRFSLQPPRQRLPTQTHFQPQPSTAATVTATSTNPNDVLHQFITGNPTGNVQPVPTIANPPPGPSGDQLLQRILSSNVADTNANKPRTLVPNLIAQPPRPINPPTATANIPIRASLSPSPSVNQTSTVQIQPSSNITIQQSPLSNSNGPHSASSQSTSYSSPLNRNATLSANGNLPSPEDELQNLIKYLKENAHRLQLLIQKFTSENNLEKLRQVQMIQQQIVQFVNNPTYEAVATAKNFRDVLERIPNRTAQANPPPAAATTVVAAAAAAPPPPSTATNSFTQCLKATHDFLAREPKERLNVSKRYLEPLADVINGVPHKIMRLDNDSYPIIKVRCTTNNSLLTTIADEINQLPKDIFSIERISDYRTRKSFDNHQQNGIILRCKLLDKANPILPPIRLHVPMIYPEQAPEILSLTKTPSPKLDFSDGHPLFERISSIFVSHLFKLRPQHTITEILNIWRQSVQTAL